jgi:hypothetical protein
MQIKSKRQNEMSEETQLVDAQGLLVALFPKESRPTVRWVRDLQKRRLIPYAKIGHLVRFNVPKVREAIERRHTINCRAA